MRPTIAHIDLPSEMVLDNLRNFLTTKNIKIAQCSLSQNHTTTIVKTEMPTFWQLITRQKQPASFWQLRQINQNQTEIQVSVLFPPFYTLKSYLISLPATISMILILSQMRSLVLGDLAVAITVFMLLLLVSMSYLLLLLERRFAHSNLKRAFFKVNNIVTITPGDINTFSEVWLSMLTLVFAILIAFALLSSNLNAFKSMLITLSFGIPISIVAISSAYFYRQFTIKTANVIFTITIGMGILLCYNTPLLIKTVDSSIYKKGVSKEVIEKLTILESGKDSLDKFSLEKPGVLRSIRLAYGIKWFFVFSFLLVIMLALRPWFREVNSYAIALNESHNPVHDSSSEKYLTQSRRLPKSLKVFYLLSWFFCFIGTITACYYAISIIAYLINPNHISIWLQIAKDFVDYGEISLRFIFLGILNKHLIGFLHQALFYAFAGSFLVFFSFIWFYRYSDNLKSWKALKKGTSAIQDDLIRAQNIADKIADHAQKKRPKVSISDISINNPNEINAQAFRLPFPISQEYIGITQGVLKRPDDELISLLAHEIEHLRSSQMIKIKFLNFLSQYTLCGKGFLLIFVDTQKWEEDADDFAVQCLKNIYNYTDEKARETVAMTLQVSQEMGTSIQLFNRGLSFLSAPFFFKSDEELQKESFVKIFVYRMKLIIHLYFGNSLAYFHPPIDQRIERIKTIKKYIISKPLLSPL